MEVQKSDLGEKIKTDSGCLRIICIVLGIGFIILGIITFPLICGIGVLFLLAGFIKTGYIYKTKCPYCGNDIQIFDSEKTHKCKYCKKISNRKDNYLETIE